MFAATDLNIQNRRREALIRILFMLMTVLLVVPVLMILGTLIYKGGIAYEIALTTTFLYRWPSVIGRQIEKWVSPRRRGR